MREVFVPINDFPNYEISNLGNVYSKNIKKNLKPKKNPNGYLQVRLRANRKTKCLYVHRLVALHFIPNPENKNEVNHIDGDKDNNCVENLEWVTHKENQHHAMKNGLLTSFQPKFNDTDIEKIIDLYVNEKLSVKKIAKIMEVTDCTIYKYLKQKNCFTKSKPFGVNFSENEKLELINDYLSGKPVTKIAEEYGVEHKRIRRFLKRNNVYK